MSIKNQSGSIATGSDVILSSVTNGQVLTYSTASAKWTNQTLATSATTGVARVMKNGDNTWPSRPVGATYVEWVGPGSPDPPYTTTGDSWIDTTA